MTVKDLKILLDGFPDDMQVCSWSDDNPDLVPISDVSEMVVIKCNEYGYDALFTKSTEKENELIVVVS